MNAFDRQRSNHCIVLSEQPEACKRTQAPTRSEWDDHFLQGLFVSDWVPLSTFAAFCRILFRCLSLQAVPGTLRCFT